MTITWSPHDCHMTITWSPHDCHTFSIIDEDPLNHFSDGGSGEESGEEEDDDEEGDLIIDERLLQKDFIVDKYTLACLYYNKVGGHPICFDLPPDSNLLKCNSKTILCTPQATVALMLPVKAARREQATVALMLPVEAARRE